MFAVFLPFFRHGAEWQSGCGKIFRKIWREFVWNVWSYRKLIGQISSRHGFCNFWNNLDVSQFHSFPLILISSNFLHFHEFLSFCLHFFLSLTKGGKACPRPPCWLSLSYFLQSDWSKHLQLAACNKRYQILFLIEIVSENAK